MTSTKEVSLFGNSPGKQALLEIGFVLSIGLATVYTAVALPVGFAQAISQGGVRGNNAWRQTGSIWGAISGHFKYLFRFVFSPHFRRFMKATRNQTRAQKKAISESWRQSRQGIGDMLSEVEYIDAETFFLLFVPVLYAGVVIWFVGLGIAGMIGAWGYRHYYSVSTPIHAPAPVTQLKFEKQAVDKQEADFGPWNKSGDVSEQANKPDFRSMALLGDDGSVKYSQTVVADRSQFTLLDNSELIVNARVVGTQVLFEDQHGNHFRINPGQGFMVANYDYRIFMFDDAGKLLAAKTTEYKKEINK